VEKNIVTEGVKLLKHVRTDREVWEYMKKQLGPNLIYRKQYNGEPIRKENQGMIMGAHRVVQQFYLRQVIPLSHPFASLLYSTLLYSTQLYSTANIPQENRVARLPLLNTRHTRRDCYPQQNRHALLLSLFRKLDFEKDLLTWWLLALPFRCV